MAENEKLEQAALMAEEKAPARSEENAKILKSKIFARQV